MTSVEINIKEKKPVGHPPTQIDWDKVDNMIIGGANGTQVAATLGIHPDTLYRNCQEEKKIGFAAYAQSKRAVGDKLLLLTQFEVAVKNKNVQMLMHLGKHRLGQNDKEDEKDKLPPQDEIIERENMIMEMKAKLEKLEEETKTYQEEARLLRAKLDNQL